MPNAILDPELLTDALVDAVDDIRRSVHGALGTRRFEVAIVTRRWSGASLGAGNPTDTVLVLDPDPQVKTIDSYRKDPGGKVGTSKAILTGVSLRYTEVELVGEGGQTVETVYRLRDKRGVQADTYFVLAEPPDSRRGENQGDASDWKIVLSETQGFAPNDGTDE